MKRVGFLLKVKENLVDEYKTHHKNTWPEMNAVLKKHGWNNYSLFIRPDGLLFGYFEADKSFQDSLAGTATEEINTKWQELMSPYFEIPEGNHPDQSILELEEIYHLD